MNKFNKIIFCLSILIFLLSFLPKSKEHTPPGTIYLEDNLYIDQYFITNIDYKEFLFFIKRHLNQLEVDSIPSSFKKYDLSYINENFVDSMQIDEFIKMGMVYGVPEIL